MRISEIVSDEVAIRVSCFVFALVFLALLERFYPLRKKAGYSAKRWFNHLSIVSLNSVAIRLVFPLLAIDMARIATDKGWGVFHIYGFSYTLSFILGFLILDFMIYMQHVMFHAVPLFWRFHRMHHADVDFDVTTGVRFHPIEIAISMGIKICVVFLFGIPALSVLTFEIVLNATSMFTHINVKLPNTFERWLRYFIVTPNMHRVHHSVHVVETNSNFGFNLSLWDRLFGTYREKPKDGHLSMQLGLHEFRENRFFRLGQILLIPFLNPKK